MNIFCSFFFYLFSIDEDVKNSAVSNDPCYSDYKSDDKSDYVMVLLTQGYTWMIFQ